MKVAKVFLFAIVAVGLMYAVVNYEWEDIVVERIENLEVETPVEVPKWQTDEDAIKAAQDVIRKKELQAELAQVEKETAEVKATYEAKTAELKAKRTAISKEIESL